MVMTKSNFILKSLRKISHKEWESFIISRILHKLDDDDIEFVTQQLVHRRNGRRSLTDLYFPQLSLHLEIDEPHHEAREQESLDALRERDIISATGHKVERIKLARKGKNGGVKDISEIRADVDKFVSLVQAMKDERVAKNQFIPWDFESQYSAAPHIGRGYISVKGNVVFKTQVEALRCFGFTGNGWQRGVWPIPDNSNDVVWFPRLYEHGNWKNELSADGKTIFEVAKNAEGRKSIKQQRLNNPKSSNRKFIVFAKSKDSLGFNLLRYTGTFVMNKSHSDPEVLRFDRVADRETIRP